MIEAQISIGKFKTVLSPGIPTGIFIFTGSEYGRKAEYTKIGFKHSRVSGCGQKAVSRPGQTRYAGRDPKVYAPNVRPPGARRPHGPRRGQFRQCRNRKNHRNSHRKPKTTKTNIMTIQMKALFLNIKFIILHIKSR